MNAPAPGRPIAETDILLVGGVSHRVCSLSTAVWVHRAGVWLLASFQTTAEPSGSPAPPTSRITNEASYSPRLLEQT